MVHPDDLKRKKSNAPATMKSSDAAGMTPSASHDQISQLAYQVYQLGGCVDGHDQQDWFTAEQKLSGQQTRKDGHGLLAV